MSTQLKLSAALSFALMAGFATLAHFASAVPQALIGG